jgi:hypothetical protein
MNQAASGEKTRVLYISGSGRSGTTIMARLLGEIEGFLNVGEASRYFYYAPLRRRGIPCGCGLPVAECPFWKDILPMVPEDLPVVGEKLLRMRRFLTLWRQNGGGNVTNEERRILDTTATVYREIVRKSGCEIVVDSSKHPANALLLSLIPEIDLSVVHVVRDPRRVVESWTKKKEYLPAHPTGKVLMWWWSYNILSEMLKSRAMNYQLVLYEDFVRDPAACLRQITSLGGDRPRELPFLHGCKATVHAQHSLAGNPDKMVTGELTIGEEKRPLSMTASKKFAVDVLAMPLEYRYRRLASAARHE